MQEALSAYVSQVWQMVAVAMLVAIAMAFSTSRHMQIGWRGLYVGLILGFVLIGSLAEYFHSGAYLAVTLCVALAMFGSAYVIHIRTSGQATSGG